MKSGKRRALFALILGTAAATACNDGSEPVVPGLLQAVAGDQQTATAGSAVPVAPSIKVMSTAGKPMAGVPVNFASSGDGVVTPSQQVTNAQGIATVVSWTLPRQAGPQRLTASTNGVTPLVINATAVAGPAAKLVRGSPDQQTAAAMATVGAAPIVKVTDANDNPVAGVTVTFTPSHAGSVGATTAISDANGLARANSWTLGGIAGVQTLIASAVGTAPVTFTATALAGAAAALRLTREPSATARAGIALTTQPIVQVTDQFGNAVSVAGVVVTIASVGNAEVLGASAITNATGTAVFSGVTLTGTAGSYNLNFSGINFTPVTSHTVRLDGGAPVKLAVVTQPSTNGSGELLFTQPVVEVQDEWSNRVLVAGHAITAAIAGTTQTLSGTTTIPAADGRAIFTDLAVTGAGDVQLRFSAFGLPETSSVSFNVPAAASCVGTRLTLNFELGQSSRFLANAPNAPACLDLVAANAGQQFAVLFENVTPRGSYTNSMFPGVLSDEASFQISISSGSTSGMTTSNQRSMTAPEGGVHSWDFGGGTIYEIEPEPPAGGAPPAVVLRNRTMDGVAGNSTNTAVVGDTIVVYLEGIPRLGIAAGNQRAVVRFVGTDVIIAEDVRLETITRQTGGKNTPLTQADMAAIAADYAAYAKVQADRFFGGRHNAATEANATKVIAVHSLMPADNIWGYTYSNTNYFVWDYWVLSDGVTKGPNQHVQRNADNLFMHEIAHMRHQGLLERANRSIRGNRWLVEGFARGSERWPIAMRVLGTADFSRTANVVLPSKTATELTSLEDVPVYTQGGLSLYAGYAQSSYIFDYFADQVAKTTSTPWMTALAEFLTFAGVENDLNAVIARYLPGLDFGTLVTRSRIAFFTDDYGPGLPDWTQYHQYQLRASRQTINTQLDPRNQWVRITPGSSFADTREITAGGSFGYVIDGTAATEDMRIRINTARVSNGIVSVTRIK